MTVSQEYGLAQALLEEALAIFQRIGHTWSSSLAALGLGDLLFAQGSLERARACLEEALPVFQDSDQLWMIAQTLYLLGKVHWRLGDKTQASKLWGESVTLSREIEAKRFLAEIYYMLGLAAQEGNDRQQALALFRQSLALYQAVQNKIGVAYALGGLAGLAKQPLLQAQLLGAASTVLATARLPYDQIERSHYEQIVAAVRAQLDEASFTAAWAEGETMSLDQCMVAIGDVNSDKIYN
jgi:tetratricopeptide (TPR) repeat protein